MSAPTARLEPIWRAALAAVEPRAAMRRAAAIEGDALRVGGDLLPLGRGRIRVVGGGKAAVPMAEALADLLGDRIETGLVIAKRGHGEERAAVGPIRIRAGGHPLPDAEGAFAAAELEALLAGRGADDLVVALLSGGGSALLALPEDGVSLADLRAATDALVLGGADIGRINAVRKHLTRLSGGRIARLAAPARVVALILSDVVGDPLDAIASGPTAPDPTTFADALAVIADRDLEDAMPVPVLDRLRRGAAGGIAETPKPGDPLFDRVLNRVVAGNRTAVEAAAAAARALGCETEVEPIALDGEARARGRELAARGVALARGATTRPACLVCGGETTVTVRGGGRGGRNQELALAAALALEASGDPSVRIAAIATDGQDGPTDAAGAVVDAGTCGRARAAGVDPEAALEDNDAYAALDAAGALVRTGPTRTNVADLAFVLVAR